MRSAPAVLILAVALIGCGGTGPTPTPSPTPDPDVALIRIEQVGGMLPPWLSLNWYPSVAVYADGRLITQGAQVELYPGPALPNLQVTQLSAAGLARVLDWAGEAGMVGPDRTIGQPLLDAPVTVFTVVTDAGVHRTTVQGINEDPAVVAAVRLQETLMSVRSWLDPAGVVGGDRAYDWQRLQIVLQPMTVEAMPDPQLVNRREWPLAPLTTLGRLIEPGAGYRCAVIEGADVGTLRPALEGANELTLWAVEDQTFQIAFHPLLPDDQGCRGL
jgi:hypothetical protein